MKEKDTVNYIDMIKKKKSKDYLIQLKVQNLIGTYDPSQGKNILLNMV